MEVIMELMTIEDVATFFKTSRNTIDIWLNRGTLPRDKVTRKIGKKRVYFIKSKLEEFILTGKVD